MRKYLSVEEAKAEVAAALPAPVRISLPLAKAGGRILAEPIVAREDLPAFASSAMDGYAVRAADVAGAGPDAPVILALAGEIAAGQSAPRDWPLGSTLRIMTGAPVPEGCAGVIPVEETAECDEGVRFLTGISAGKHNIRPLGEDVRAGEPLLPAGLRLDAAALALLAAQGVSEPSVFRLPRVSFLATGDELVAANESPGPGGIRNSNGPLALSLLAESGFPARDLGIAPDDPSRLREMLAAALAESDLLITSGGVSMGRYDLVGELLVGLGAEWVFHRVRQRPGKPLAFLCWRGKPVFGLPGNPVSTFMTLWYYTLPALRRMCGQPDPEPFTVSASLGTALRGTSERAFFVRAWTEWEGRGWLAEPRPPHGSHLLSSLARSNSFLILPAGCGDLPVGAEVRAAFFAPRMT